MAPENRTNRRTKFEIAGAREATALAATLGAEAKRARDSARITQAELARRVGLRRTRYAELERGEGATAPLRVWVGIGQAIGRPLAVGFSRGAATELHDAGHLAVQELVLSLAERNGVGRQFELPTRPANPSLSIDVLLRQEVNRTLLIVEIWNRLDDLGAAVRNLHRKQSEASAVAVVAGGAGQAYRVAACWVLRDSAANRALVRRYPTVLRTAFPGSSRAWVDALERGTPPPAANGILWAHPANGLSALNLRRVPLPDRG